MAATRKMLKPPTRATQLVRRIVDALPLNNSPGARPTAATSAIYNRQPATSTATEKTIHDLNGPPAWPIVGNFVTYIKKENRGRLHEALADQHKKYGKMFKEKLGPNTQLHVCDPNLIENIFRHSNEDPIRPPFDSWKTYRHSAGKAMGLVTSEGETWRRTRNVLSKKLLTPKIVSDYTEVMNETASDMIDKIRYVQRHHGEASLVEQLPNELYKWAMEGMGAVLFDRRMGCMNQEIPDKVQEFIDAIHSMMTTSLYIIVGDKLHKRWNTPFWRKHKEAWDKIFDIGAFYINEKIQDLNERLGADPDNNMSEDKAGFLEQLLASDKLTIDEKCSNLVELFLSGIDTTSNTLCFVLYLLSQNEGAQKRLREEIDTVLEGRPVTYGDLSKLTYLKGVFKESLRLFPVITMNVRILSDDLNLEGYNIPKKTLCVMNHFAVCRDPERFDKADQFIPERWLRTDPEFETKHPFNSLPFGFGARRCIGQRVAELEVYVAVARILQSFELKPFDKVEFKPTLRTILTAGKALPVSFVDR